MRSPLFAEANKKPVQNQQVHDQEDAVDPSQGSISTLGPDVVETIPALPLTKFTLDRNAVVGQTCYLDP
ncbi:MAG: hypothetical protein V3U75_04705 [Methylococcaceae bacterium]